MKKYFIWIGVFYLIFSVAASAAGETALQTVKQQVNQLLEVLKSDAGKVQKEERIRKQAIQFFDFESMSKLALSYHWKKMTPEQRKQFVVLYRELLESVYMDRLLRYKEEKVNFINETRLSDTRSEVQTSVVSQGKEIPMVYKLILQNGSWKVYDLVIENVSLARNYRSQFSSFLQDKSYDDLLGQLRSKTQGSG